MALNAAMTWYNRTGGVEANGGGFDSTISGAGTNYADQDAPQLSITDLASTASTTVTSVTGGFTAAMIGNVLRLASATGSPVADSAGSRYLAITGYTDTNTITVDKVSGTYTLGIAKVGGAHATLVNYSNGGSGLATPALTSPLAPGHTVYIRSAGSAADPSIAGTPDYDYSAGYWQFPSGNRTVGTTHFIGLGASETIVGRWAKSTYRPLIKTSGLLHFSSNHIICSNLKTFGTSTPTYVNEGVFGGSYGGAIFSIHDVNGGDARINGSGPSQFFLFNWVKNTGGTTAGTKIAIAMSVEGVVGYNLVTDYRGIGMAVTSTGAGAMYGNIVANCHADAFSIDGDPGGGAFIVNNVAYNPVGHGFTFTQAGLAASVVLNNSSSKIASGKYAFNVSAGTAAANDLLKKMFNYNNAYLDGGAGGLYNAISAGPNDTNLDPQFTDPTSATWDFSIGTNLKAKGIGQVPFA